MMYRIYRQSRSDHPRTFTGTLLRAEIRTRSGHDNRTLIRLIDIQQASQQLRLPTASLQLAAKHGLLPHYTIDGHLRFDPAELTRWVREHRIDEYTPTLSLDDCCTGWDEGQEL
jgi:hypothetical protein